MNVRDLTLADLTVEPPPSGPADWNDDGVVILPNFIQSELITAYQNAWQKANGFHGLRVVDRNVVMIDADDTGGWDDCVPYMRHIEILNLVAPLEDELFKLTNDSMGMHLNLTGWVTTARDWHQDQYLNETEVGDYYAAVWIALGDIHPDTGPFQYVPGSHRWPQVTRDLIAPYVNIDDPDWPRHSEEILSPLFNDEIVKRNAEVVTYLPKKGDVLIWHGRLLHRGSIAKVKGSYRPAFIAHFSGIHHRPKMSLAQPYWKGGWFFPIESENKQTSRGM